MVPPGADSRSPVSYSVFAARRCECNARARIVGQLMAGVVSELLVLADQQRIEVQDKCDCRQLVSTTCVSGWIDRGTSPTVREGSGTEPRAVASGIKTHATPFG